MQCKSLTPCLILSALSLSGCATQSTLSDAQPILTVPETLRVPCETPSELVTGTVAELAVLAVDDARKLIDCGRRHFAVIKLIERYEQNFGKQ